MTVMDSKLRTRETQRDEKKVAEHHSAFQLFHIISNKIANGTNFVSDLFRGVSSMLPDRIWTRIKKHQRAPLKQPAAKHVCLNVYLPPTVQVQRSSPTFIGINGCT